MMEKEPKNLARCASERNANFSRALMKHIPISGLSLTLLAFKMTCFILSTMHSATCDVWLKTKAWFVRPHYTTPVTYFPRLWFLAHWGSTALSAYVSNGLLRCTRLQMFIACSSCGNVLSLKVGMTFIHWLQQFLSGMDAIFIHKPWYSFLVPLNQDFFSITILMSSFVARYTPLLVDSLNSPLRKPGKSRNFTHRMVIGTAKHNFHF